MIEAFDRAGFFGEARRDGRAQQVQQFRPEPFAVLVFERLRTRIGENADAIADDGIASLVQDPDDILANLKEKPAFDSFGRVDQGTS